MEIREWQWGWVSRARPTNAVVFLWKIHSGNSNTRAYKEDSKWPAHCRSSSQNHITGSTAAGPRKIPFSAALVINMSLAISGVVSILKSIQILSNILAWNSHQCTKVSAPHQGKPEQSILKAFTVQLRFFSKDGIYLSLLVDLTAPCLGSDCLRGAFFCFCAVSVLGIGSSRRPS